jgi:hypothetical protein
MPLDGNLISEMLDREFHAWGFKIPEGATIYGVSMETVLEDLTSNRHCDVVVHLDIKREN